MEPNTGIRVLSCVGTLCLTGLPAGMSVTQARVPTHVAYVLNLSLHGLGVLGLEGLLLLLLLRRRLLVGPGTY
jgi:hypothetical protein